MLSGEVLSAVDVVRGLSVEDIRRRLEENDAEARALRVLLRAALAKERSEARRSRKE